jgi:transposase
MPWCYASIEKTGMQALGRKHPFQQAALRRARRLDCEYIRHGTRTLLAALNPHTGDVYAEVRATRKADDLVGFMEAVARRYPRKKIYVIWDSLNIHGDGKDRRWQRFNRRHRNRFRFVYTPFHASWVNQVEMFFSVVQKRVLRYGVFNSAKELQHALLRFIHQWNHREAHPFRWTFKGYPLVRIFSQGCLIGRPFPVRARTWISNPPRGLSTVALALAKALSTSA